MKYEIRQIQKRKAEPCHSDLLQTQNRSVVSFCINKLQEEKVREIHYRPERCNEYNLIEWQEA